MGNCSMIILALLATALLPNNAKSQPPADIGLQKAANKSKSLLSEFSELVAVGLPRNNASPVLIDMSKVATYANHTELIELCPVPSPYGLCENAYVFADPKEWLNNGTKTIRYMLNDVEAANIRGHNIYHNKILNLSLKKPSVIVGGRSSNYYGIEFADSYVQFHLNSASKNETIDLSNAVCYSNMSIKFSAAFDSIYGYLNFDNLCPATLTLTGDGRITTGDSVKKLLAIHGRAEKLDTIECSNHQMIDILGPNHKIYADGKGGLDDDNMDVLTNCLQNEVRPLTTYEATYEGMKYEFNAILESTQASAAINFTKKKSKILLNEADALLTVNDIQKLLQYQLISMEYIPTQNKLILMLSWSDSITLELEVNGILKNPDVVNQTQSLKNVALTIKLADDSLIPVVRKNEPLPESVDDIKKFHMDILMSGQKLVEARTAYDTKVAPHITKWLIETLVTSSVTNNTFYFGTSDEDSIFIESNSKYAEGQNGSDVYKWTSDSPQSFWIDNKASDGQLDVLDIETKLCKLLEANKRVVNDSLMLHSDNDLTVTCLMKKKQTKKIVLMNYLEDTSKQHIKILRNELQYMILPHDWLFPLGSDSTTFMILEIIDLTGNKNYTIKSNDPTGYWIVQVPDEPSKQLHDRRTSDGKSLLLSTNSAGSSITLLDFFDDDDDIMDAWMNKVFFVVSELKSNEKPRILKGLDLEDLTRISDD